MKKTPSTLLALTTCLWLTSCASSTSTANTALDAAQSQTSEELAAIEDAQKAVENSANAAEDATRAQALTEQAQATAETSAVVQESWVQVAENERELQRQALNEAIDHQDGVTARQLFDAMDTSDLSKEEKRSLNVSVMIAEGRYDEARKLVRHDADKGNTRAREDYWRAFDADPRYGASFTRTVRPEGNNSLHALGGGSTVSLKYKVNDTTIAAIKPDQDLRQTMYRSEIAFFRICEILGCAFDVPENVPVRFKKSDFNALYATNASGKNAGYRSKFEHLIWANENGEQYLYATQKEWITPFSGLPVEQMGNWRSVVEPDGTHIELRDLLKRMLAGGRPTDINNLSKYTDWTKDLSTKDFARQLSDLMLLDFLTNNWDRFSQDPGNYGANCHIQPGGIIAIDNGAAFPAWHAPRVVKRLDVVKVFHRDLVTRLRALTPETLNDRLFPNPTKEEKKSLQRFWERRDQALKHIDQQIAKYGEDAVLAF